ncbi:MAG: hypothetical protein V3U92_11405 [Cellulophaga sp.]
MKLITRIFDFYIDASIHVALAVFSLVHITALTLRINLNENLSYVAFFGTIVMYNFVKYGIEAEKYILVANRYHKNIQFFSLLAFGGALYFARFLSVDIWIGVGVLLFITGLYALPVLPQAKNLRSLGGFKIFLVAIVWAGTTVFLVVLSASEKLSWDVWIEGIQRFIIVFVLLIPFEIRDLKYDAPDLRTLPQQFGVTNVKFFGAFATLLFFLLTFLKDTLSTTEALHKGILFLLLGALMFVTRRNQTNYFSSFWVESIPIVWWGIIWGLMKII